jgi:hypothetical protein
MTSAAVETEPISTVTISDVGDQSTVSFLFEYSVVKRPASISSSPVQADITSNKEILLRFSDVHPDITLEDITLEIQRSMSLGCSSLGFVTTSGSWECRFQLNNSSSLSATPAGMRDSCCCSTGIARTAELCCSLSAIFRAVAVLI